MFSEQINCLFSEAEANKCLSGSFRLSRYVQFFSFYLVFLATKQTFDSLENFTNAG